MGVAVVAEDEMLDRETVGDRVEVEVGEGAEVEVGLTSGVDTMRRGMLETETDAAVSIGVVVAGAESLVIAIELRTGAGALADAAVSTLLTEVATATSSPAVTQTVCTTSTVAVTTSQAVTTTRSRLSSGAAAVSEARRKPSAK